jgi:hypothetical protein
MSYQANTAFVQQYKNTVELLLQHNGSKLRSAVTNGNYTGKAAKAIEQVGVVTPVKNMARHADTPLISTPQDARWVFPNDYDWSDLIDDQDKLRMIIDPQSSYAQAAMMSMGRAMDEEILAAAVGASRTGENGTTTTAFDTNMAVGVNVGGTNSGLNVTKLRNAKRLLMARGVDIDNDPLYVVITAADHDALLNEIQVVSSDYNTTPVMVNGKVQSFLGFNFIHVEYTLSSNYPQAAANTALVNGSTRTLPYFARSGLHLAMWNDLSVSIDRRADKRNSTQIYVTGTFGATRTQEGKVGTIAAI